MSYTRERKTGGHQSKVSYPPDAQHRATMPFRPSGFTLQMTMACDVTGLDARSFTS